MEIIFWRRINVLYSIMFPGDVIDDGKATDATEFVASRVRSEI